jgi:hypothetical protein
MRPPRIPPMITGIVQTAICAFDGVEFDRREECPFCGGPVLGYDTRQKKFAVLQEADHERTITVRVKRFTCRTCKRLSNAEEPFYPDSRIGSIIVDLYTTLSTTIPHSRAARIIDAMGIRVDRTSWRNYHNRVMPEIPTTDMFGMRLPQSVLTFSTIAARTPERSCIEGAEALAACGFPSAFRTAQHRPLPVQEQDDRDNDDEKEERQADHP